MEEGKMECKREGSNLEKQVVESNTLVKYNFLSMWFDLLSYRNVTILYNWE